jgi:hypothetical protein
VRRGSSLRKERDLREYARGTQRRLIFGVLILLFLIGDGLIFLLYGKDAGKFALICTALGLAPLALIYSGISIFAWLARKGMDD